MPKTTSFIFEDKDVIAADKKYFIVFWITSISAVALAIICILLTATVFLNNPNAQMITMVCGSILVVSILLLGSIAMGRATDDFIRAADMAFRRHMSEQIRKLYEPHV